VSCEIAANHHFYFEWLTFESDSNVLIRRGNYPVRHQVFCSFEIVRGDLVKNAALIGNTAAEDDIEGGNPVGGDDEQAVLIRQISGAMNGLQFAFRTSKRR
jgi:hypothetical protein